MVANGTHNENTSRSTRRAPKDPAISDPDLRLLDAYRRSFGEAYEAVMRQIRDGLGMHATGRFAKSTTSIVEKLRREASA